MLGRSRKKLAIELLLDSPPTPSSTVNLQSHQLYTGLPGYDPTLGPHGVLTGKVLLTLPSHKSSSSSSSPFKDLDSLYVTFIGRVEVDAAVLLSKSSSGSSPPPASSSSPNRISRHFSSAASTATTPSNNKNSCAAAPQVKYLVKERLELKKWSNVVETASMTSSSSTICSFPFAIHMSKYSHLPSSANTPFGRVIYEVEATLIKATTSTSSNLSVTRSVKFTRCHARTTPRAGLRMVNGCTKNGLFQYEITLPKELHVDQQQHLRLCVKLTYDNLLKLPFSIEEVQLNLKEERVYLVETLTSTPSSTTISGPQLLLPPAIANVQQRIGQSCVIGKPVRYKETLKETAANMNNSSSSFSSGLSSDMHFLNSILSSSSSSNGDAASDCVKVMTFTIPIGGDASIVADMNIHEMMIRHFVGVQIEYKVNGEHQPAQLIDIPLPVVNMSYNSTLPPHITTTTTTTTTTASMSKKDKRISVDSSYFSSSPSSVSSPLLSSSSSPNSIRSFRTAQIEQIMNI